MNIGILLPGFSSDNADYAIPVQSSLMALLSQSNDVRVLALRYPHRRDRYNAFGAEVISLGYAQARGLRRLLLWRDALRTLARLHHEQPFDVFHAMWADETGLIATWAGRRLGVPSVVSILGGELVGLDDIRYGHQRTAFGRWIVGQALRADRVITPSDTMQSLIAEAGYQVPEARHARIHLGADGDLFHPSGSPPGLSKPPYRLLQVASLVPVKDQITLLRAVALLPEVTLDLVGTGSQRAALEHLAEDLRIADRVHFHGAVTFSHLPALFQQAHLFVLTSRHEANAIAALEALACGVPVITTAVGALPEHPDIAITVPVRDPATLARTIRTLLHDPARYQALRAAALVKARNLFDIRITARALEKLYQQLLKK